jgi:hypothetical protein
MRLLIEPFEGRLCAARRLPGLRGNERRTEDFSYLRVPPGLSYDRSLDWKSGPLRPSGPGLLAAMRDFPVFLSHLAVSRFIRLARRLCQRGKFK